MGDYEQDEFYDTYGLTVEQKKEILKDAIDCSFDWHVDLLDARKSWQRQKTEMSLDEILNKLDDDCHFVFIHRKGFKGSREIYPTEYVVETGFSTMRGEPTYFLFIFCLEENLSKLIEKHHLFLKIL